MKVGRQALNDAAGEQFFDVAQLAEEAAAVDVRLRRQRVRPMEVLKGVKVGKNEKKKVPVGVEGDAVAVENGFFKGDGNARVVVEQM